MDVKDTKLLAALDDDPRMSEKKLAKRIGVSQQVVSYRLKSLQRLQLRCGAIINHSLLGYHRYHLLLRAERLLKDADIVAALRKKPNVYWLARTGGKWDFSLVLYVKDYAELEAFIDMLFSQFALQDYDALYIPEHRFFSHGYLGNSRHAFILGPGEHVSVDALDERILQLIAGNCRTPMLQIAQATKVNYKTVQQRIRRMEEQTLIAGYRLFLNSREIRQQPYLVLLHHKSSGRADEQRILRFAQEHTSVTQASKAFGAYSFLLHMRVSSAEALQSTLIQMRHLFPSLGDCEIVPIFEDYAINLLPGTVRKK
jgi:Lrp/AsnC family transcriptional regulator, leucine-responsive regulatory protein